MLIESEISTTVRTLLQFVWIQKIKYIIPTNVDGAQQTTWGALCLTDLWTDDKNVNNKKLNLSIYEDITHGRNSPARNLGKSPKPSIVKSFLINTIQPYKSELFSSPPLKQLCWNYVGATLVFMPSLTIHLFLW